MADTKARSKPGPPKTKDYTTVSLKIPQALLSRVQRYAKRHQRPVSELFRDGVEWRIGDGDLLSQRYATGSSAEQAYSGNTEIPDRAQGETASHGVLQEILATLARQEVRLQALAEALEQRPAGSTPTEYSGNTMKVSPRPHSTPKPAQKGDRRQTPQEEHTADGNTVLQGNVPAFDSTRHFMGQLCRHGHAYGTTGQSVRNKQGGECVRCVADRQARSKAKRRQTQPV